MDWGLHRKESPIKNVKYISDQQIHNSDERALLNSAEKN
jgi:hypothetical protein